MISSTLVKIAAAEEAERESQEYYPRCSVAGPERCRRSQTYWALGYPRSPFPGRFVILLQDSTFHEELTADWIRKSAFTLHSEQMGLDCDTLPFGEDKPRSCKLCNKEIAGNIVHGHTDGIITDILMNDSIWEHKALNHFTFEMYWKGDKYPLDYITQGCLYKKGVSKVNPHVKNICLNIKNKNTSQMIDYVIEYDIETDIAKVVEVEHSNGKKKYPDFVYENVIAIARQRFIEIEDFRSRDELPEREFDREDWQCLSPDTLIILANGKYKEISKIQKGDIVKSINGTTKVKYVGCKKSDKQWVCVKPIGLLDIVCTEDHRWLIAQWESATKYHTKEAFIPEYIEAKNIPLAKNRKYAVVLIPVHKPCFVHTELNIEECKFLGFYVAEGCLANWQNEKYYRVIFTIHENETALANEIINLGISLFSCNHTNEVIIDKRTGWKSRRIIFNSVHMVNFIRSHITGKAINKELSSSIMGARDKCIKAFLDAAIIGDGYINPKQKSTTLSTSSKKLCLQYQQLFWRLGIPAIAQYASKPSKRMGYETVQGYRVQYQGNYHVIQFININGTTFAASRIRNITPIEERYDAWDLEVESKMHNFSTHSGIVHNCDYCLYGSKCYEGYEREFNAMTEDATLEGSIVELCSLYLEQVNYEKDAKTHKEELNAKIKDILRSQNIRKGKTGQGIPGDYTINWRLQHEERIMPKAEIPDDILPRILKQSIKEILTIRKIPAKKEG